MSDTKRMIQHNIPFSEKESEVVVQAYNECSKEKLFGAFQRKIILRYCRSLLKRKAENGKRKGE